jgi:hypothetical protein
MQGVGVVVAAPLPVGHATLCYCTLEQRFHNQLFYTSAFGRGNNNFTFTA